MTNAIVFYLKRVLLLQAQTYRSLSVPETTGDRKVMFPHVCKKIKLECGLIPGPKQQRLTQDPKSQAGLSPLSDVISRKPLV